MEIRNALPEEATYLSDLAFRSKGFWPYDKNALAKYRPNLEVHIEDIIAGVVYVGLKNQKIIGFYILSSAPKIHRLYFLFVEPEYIGRGYGKKLWEHAILNARNKKWKSITFFADDFAVKKFYQYMSCKVIGRMKTDLEPLNELHLELL